MNIIDASVAIKWFVEEPDREAALSLLDKVKESPKEFAVPELFFNEVLSFFCRVLDETADIIECMNMLQDLGFARLGNGRELLAQAATMSRKYNLSGYDAIYAANAKLTKGVWITADQIAHKKLAGVGISRCLTGLDSFKR